MGRRATPRTRLIAVCIISALFILFGAAVAGFGIRDVSRARASVTWPTAQGTVRVSQVGSKTSETRSRGTTRTSSSSHATIIYDYTVDGATYHGNRVTVGDTGSTEALRPSKIVDRYPVGATVAVYYMPGNPGESVLEPGVTWKAWVLPGFGAGFFLFGAFLLGFIPKLVRMQRAAP